MHRNSFGTSTSRSSMREPKKPSPDNSVAICKLIEAYDQRGCLGDDAFRHAFNSAINALRASHVHVPEISQAHMRWLSGLFFVGTSVGMGPKALRDLQE